MVFVFNERGIGDVKTFFLSFHQVKRQEHIYELIITEKRHCQILLLMQKVFVESLQRHFSHLNLERLFPRLQELTDLHTGYV